MSEEQNKERDEVKVFKTGNEILEVEDLPVEIVHVPEWKTSLRLRGLSGDGIAQYVVNAEGASKSSSIAQLLVLCAINEDGSLMFTKEDTPRLMKKSMSALMRLQEVLMKLNGMGEAAKKLAKNV